ncbi:MAG: mucoidy inhibitor MuiA family protein [Chitinivibrionales bacterium]|nr:mucoidy inhibitor MuiA family protein [Chitinivibrionales bacterium]
MKKRNSSIFSTVLLSLVLLIDAQAASPEPISSTITDVTVYSDRALVLRTGSLSLSPGKHVISFENLPKAIDRHSIQVSGTGNAVLYDIRFLTKHLDGLDSTAHKKLLMRKETLEDSLVLCDNLTAQAQAERTFVDNITKKLTAVAQEKDTPVELDPDKWIKMVDFYRSKLSELDKETRSTVHLKRELKERLDKVNREIQDLGVQKSTMKNVVEVTVNQKNAGTLKLTLSYIVHGPTWYPSYDLRASTAKKSMTVVYNAMVRQSTEEDWKNVKLNLSTARPSVSGRHPELQPWYVQQSRPVVYSSRGLSKAKRAAAPSAMANQMFIAEEAEALGDLALEPEPVMETRSATVETKATSVVYAIKGKSTIESDNQEHRVSVTALDFPVSFRYSSVPKLAPNAYLKTKATNTSDFMLLAGKANIFMDDNFVGNSQMDQVSPSEEFWTFLGVDDGIGIEHKLIKKYHSKEGVINKKKKLIYEYLITIKSNKKNEEELVVWDQIPVSNNKEIVVSLIEPDISDKTKDIKMNEHNYIEWFFKVKPGQELKVPFKFSVEYPEGMQVDGLE